MKKPLEDHKPRPFVSGGFAASACKVVLMALAMLVSTAMFKSRPLVRSVEFPVQTRVDQSLTAGGVSKVNVPVPAGPTEIAAWQAETKLSSSAWVSKHWSASS